MTAPAGVEPGDGRFSRDKLAAVLAEICGMVDLDHRGAILLRFTNNAVFRLVKHPVVVRIVASRAMSYRVAKVVSIATWLAEHDVPAVRLLPGIEQPLRSGQYVATLWQAVSADGRAPSGADLARLLRRLHDLPPPPFSLPSWAPLDDVRRRIADAEHLDAEDRQFLEERCAEVQVQLGALDFQLPPGVVHGDAHLGNIISGAQGAVLCDFDSASIGPREWDLTPLPVGVRRFGHPRRWYRQLTRCYGFDVTRWSGFTVLRQVRELKLTTSVLPILLSNPDVGPELRRRLHSFRSGDTSTRWSTYR